jgi:hypothetical protein
MKHKNKLTRTTQILLSSFVILLLVTLSCNKQKDNETSKQISLKDLPLPPIQSNPWSKAVNSANPLDAVGYYHNKGLDYLFKKHVLTQRKTQVSNSTARVTTPADNELIYDESMNYIGSEFGAPVQEELQTTVPYVNPSDSDLSGEHFIDLSLNITSQINNLPASYDEINKTSELLNLLLDTTAYYAGDYDLTKQQIINWESSVMNSSTFSLDEKNTLLATGSILRYSLLYWSEYDNTQLQMVARVAKFRLLRWLGWLLVSAADAIGGFCGFWAAGTVGAIGFAAAGSGAAVYVFSERGW